MRFDYSKNVLSVLGYFWQRVWKDEDFVVGMSNAVGTMQQQTDITYNEFKEYVSRLTVPVSTHRRWVRLSFLESEMSARSYGVYDGLQVDHAVLIGSSVPPIQYLLPWLSTLQTPFITSTPSKEEGTILNLGADYEIQGNQIIFYKNPFDVLPNGAGVDVNGDPVSTVECWAYCSEKDIGGIKDFFGTYVGVNTRSATIFERLTNSIWDLYVQGATITNINQFLLVMTDCDPVTASGTVVSVFTEADREWVQTDTGLYSAPEGTGILVSVDDHIEAGQNIYDTFKIYDGHKPVPDTVVASFRAESGYLGGGYISGLSFDNKEVPLSFTYMSGNPEVDVLETTNNIEWLVTDSNGVTQVLVASDYETGGFASMGVVPVPIFEIGGFPEDIQKLRQTMATNIWQTQTDTYAALTEGQAPPFKINPFAFIQEAALKNNIIFIDLDASALVDITAVMSALRYLVNTVPAGTSFMISLHNDTPEDVFDMTVAVEETVSAYIAGDLEEEYEYTNIVDTLHANRKVG